MRLINRYFLLGLGLGLIIAAMFFSVIEKRAIPKQIVIEEARKIGMVFRDEVIWQKKAKDSDGMNKDLGIN